MGFTTVTKTNTDLNDYDTTGIYSFSSTYAPVNIPIGVNGILFVTNINSFIKQIWLRYGTPGTTDSDMYTRTHFKTDGWSAWKKIIVQSDLNGIYDVRKNKLSAVDLNTITDAGSYYVVDGSTELNYPNGTNGLLLVYRTTNIIVRQFFYRVGTVNVNDTHWYTRQIDTSTSVYGVWEKIISNSDINAISPKTKSWSTSLKVTTDNNNKALFIIQTTREKITCATTTKGIIVTGIEYASDTSVDIAGAITYEIDGLSVTFTVENLSNGSAGNERLWAVIPLIGTVDIE